jgi:hypothetical protein
MTSVFQVPHATIATHDQLVVAFLAHSVMILVEVMATIMTLLYVC